MALTLRVSDGETVSGIPALCVFEADRVTIGSSPADDLTLPASDGGVGPEQVVLDREEDVYRVTGGGGLDATHLNDRVVADRGPLPLGEGDVLRVGPYALEAGAVGADTDAPPAPSAAEPPAGEAQDEAAERARDAGDSEGPAPVVEVLTDALAEALHGPRQFREEFVGHPFVHPPGAQFLYEGEGRIIREHLLDPALTAPEREQRLGYLQEAVEALALHQFAVLDGYKASVQAGLDELLGRLDPAAHRADVAGTHTLFETLPALAEPVVLVRLREECHALLREDWSVVEQRVFRPAFAKAYLEQMKAPHGAKSG